MLASEVQYQEALQRVGAYSTGIQSPRLSVYCLTILPIVALENSNLRMAVDELQETVTSAGGR